MVLLLCFCKLINIIVLWMFIYLFINVELKFISLKNMICHSISDLNIRQINRIIFLFCSPHVRSGQWEPQDMVSLFSVVIKHRPLLTSFWCIALTSGSLLSIAEWQVYFVAVWNEPCTATAVSCLIMEGSQHGQLGISPGRGKALTFNPWL